MPIYEYRCEACGHQDDHLQKISEPQLTVCPACSKPTYKKMLSAAGFQLKGSGWYATDFKNSGAKPATKTEVKTGDKAAAKSDGKDSTAGKSDKKDSSSGTSGGNTESKSNAAA